MDLKEVGCEPKWMDLSQDWDQWRAYVRAEINQRVPKKSQLVTY